MIIGSGELQLFLQIFVPNIFLPERDSERERERERERVPYIFMTDCKKAIRSFMHKRVLKASLLTQQAAFKYISNGMLQLSCKFRKSRSEF